MLFHSANTSDYALYPKSRHVSPRVRAFIDFVADLYGKTDPQ
jgi:DNA-binding transcriptional LysR family regulator